MKIDDLRKKIVLIIIVLMELIIVFCLILAITTTDSSNFNNMQINYKYYDQFVDILHNESTAYTDVTEEFLLEQYEVWYSNHGYSDIIIGMDDNLEFIQ